MLQTHQFASQDLTLKFQHFLSPEAQAAMSRISPLDPKHAYQNAYLVVRVARHQMDVGIQLMADHLNRLAQQELIVGALEKPLWVDLMRMPGQVENGGILCMLIVPKDRLEEVKREANQLLQSEGMLPEPLHSLEMDIPVGQVLVKIDVNHHLSTVDNFQHTLDRYLQILPEGTKIVEVNKCGINGLALAHEVLLANSLLAAFKEVRAHFTREVARVGDGIETFELLDRVEYIRR